MPTGRAIKDFGYPRHAGDDAFGMNITGLGDAPVTPRTDVHSRTNWKSRNGELSRDRQTWDGQSRGRDVNIEKVLMIEDDPNIRLIAEIALEGVGNWTVLLADCGEAGIEIALKEKPDLILLDVMMPGMDGPTTLARLKESMNPPPPVIFLTAKVQSTEVEHYLSLGAAGVIRKPFDPLTLPDEIMALLNGSEAPLDWQERAAC